MINQRIVLLSPQPLFPNKLNIPLYLHQSKSVIAAITGTALAAVTATEQKKKYKNKKQYAVVRTKKVTAAVVVSEHKTNTSENFGSELNLIQCIL